MMSQICIVVKQDAGCWRVNFWTFLNEKKSIFSNTIKISFCIKGGCAPCQIFDQRRKNDQKKKKNVKKWLSYPYLASYNTREADLHRRISVGHESRNIQHTKKFYATFVERLWCFADLQGRFGRFANLAL